MDKQTIRREIREKKRTLTPERIEAASEQLCRMLTSHPAYQNANSLYCYLSYNQEVRTDPLLRQAQRDGKRIAVPKLYGDEMRFLWLDELAAVAPGRFGIPEPIANEPEADDETALVLMPGLAFDAKGNRCGYGRGYYDRYLEKHPLHPTAALCFDFQLLPSVPAEETDVPVGFVLSVPV